MAERDPLFARYKSAWRAYQAVQAPDSPAETMPYKRALTESTDANVRAAAQELAAARKAWLTDPTG